MCNVDRFFLLNTATSAKAAQHKLTGKLNSNVNFVYLDCPVSPVCPDHHDQHDHHDHHDDGDHDDNGNHEEVGGYMRKLEVVHKEVGGCLVSYNL